MRENGFELHRRCARKFEALRPALLQQGKIGGTAMQRQRRSGALHVLPRIPLKRRILPAHGPAEGGEHPFVGLRLATRHNRRLHAADHVTAVGALDFLLFQERHRRQQNIGKASRVGQHLFENHGKQIVTAQPGQHRILIRRRGHRVAIVHKQRLHRWIEVRSQHRAQPCHVEASRAPGKPAENLLCGHFDRAAVAHGVPAAAHAELRQQRRQGKDGCQGLAAIAIALHSPAAANHRRCGFGVNRRQAPDSLCRNPGHRRCTVQRPLRRLLQQRFQAIGMISQKDHVQGAALLPNIDQRQGQRQVGAGINRQMQIDFGIGKGLARIDRDNKGAIAFGLFQKWHQVDVRHFWIGAPEHDTAGRGVIRVGHTGHFAVHAHRHLRGRRRAKSLCQSRRAQPGKKIIVQALLAEQAVGTAVVKR